MKCYSHRRKLWLLLPSILAVVAVAIWITMLLWNALLPGLFHFPAITYWQTAGLLLLLRLLLGGMHGFHHHDHSHKRRFQDRWERFNPEEREEAFKSWSKLRDLWYDRNAQEHAAGKE